MNIIIVGYGEMLKALILGVLKSEHKLVGVFRNDNLLHFPLMSAIYDFLMPSEDYNFIKLNNLHDIKAKSVNSKKFINKVKELNADIILVGSWSEKFSNETINTPNIACINLHPSLLPRYRGSNPYMQVILNNENKTGITFHYMNSRFDAGEILLQSEVPIFDTDTGQSLKLRCCDAAQKEVIKLLNNFKEFEQKKIPQDELISSYQSRISLAESILDFEKETSEEIIRRIRALTPWLNCHIFCKNRFFKFSNYQIIGKSDKPAASITDKTNKSISIVCKDGVVIKFNSVEMVNLFSKILTKIYLDKFIKINEKAG